MTPDSPLEVELKFRLSEPQSVLQRILAMPVLDKGTSSQRDQYFSHPCRNFRKTDEALRIRYADNQAILTYKGPKLSGPIKSREELEWHFDNLETVETKSSPPIDWLLTRLGFQPVAVVSKKRQWFQLLQDNIPLTVSVDEVDQLGWFAEIEATCTDANRAHGEQAVLRLSNHLDLDQPVTASYLGMLLKKYSD